MITMQQQEQKSESKTIAKFDILQVPIVRFLLYLLIGCIFIYVGLDSFKLNVSSIEVSGAIFLTGCGFVLFGIRQIRK